MPEAWTEWTRVSQIGSSARQSSHHLLLQNTSFCFDFWCHQISDNEFAAPPEVNPSDGIIL